MTHENRLVDAFGMLFISRETHTTFHPIRRRLHETTGRSGVRVIRTDPGSVWKRRNSGAWHLYRVRFARNSNYLKRRRDYARR